MYQLVRWWTRVFSKRSTWSLSFLIFWSLTFFCFNCLYICKSIRSTIASWLTGQWASGCVLCFAHIYCPANWEDHVSWKRSRKCVSTVLEEILQVVWFRAESHNIYHLTTKDTKIYDNNPTKKTQLCCEMPICIHIVVKGVEPSLLGYNISLPLLVSKQTGRQFDQTDDQPERSPPLTEIPLQTD